LNTMDIEAEREHLRHLEDTLKRFAKDQDVHVPRVPELARVLLEEELVPAMNHAMERVEERAEAERE
jgi:hypothetical protein